MAKKKTIINPNRGWRLRTILREHELTQQQAAEKFGYSVIHVSAIINGKRNLTLDFANNVISEFPEYRIEWLLDQDDFKTVSEFAKYREEKDLDEGMTMMNYIHYIAEAIGYSVAYTLNDEVILSKNHKTLIVPLKEWLSAVGEVDIFANFVLENEIEKLIRKKDQEIYENP